MDLVVSDGLRTLEVQIGTDSDPTIGSICATVLGLPAADRTPGEVYAVDGRPIDSDVPLSVTGAVSGSVISMPGTLTVATDGADTGRVRLAVLAGPGAGMSVPLTAGRHTLGCGPGVDIALRAPGVRPHHLDLTVEIPDRVAVVDPGTGRVRQLAPASTVTVGACVLGIVPMVGPASTRFIAGRRGTAPFNRPPRRFGPDAIRPVTVPVEPQPPGTSARPGVFALLVPLVFAGVMAVMYDPRFALFGLLSPIMMIGNWLEDRRRMRKFRRQRSTDVAAACATLTTDLRQALSAETVRRHRMGPSVATLAQWADGGATRIWERQPQHDDFLSLTVGYGRQPWRPPLSGNGAAAPPEIAPVLADNSVLPMGPIPLDLDPGQILGVAGHRTTALSLVRGLVTQAAVLHGPAHLQIAVLTAEPSEWTWTRWLPHTIADTSTGMRLLGGTDDEIGQVVSLLTPAPVEPGTFGSSAVADGPMSTTLLVVDIDDLSPADRAPVRHLLGGRGGPIAAIVMSSAASHLPALCTRVATTGVDTVTLHPDDEMRSLRPAGATVQVAEHVARKLSRWDDPDRCEDGAELPGGVALLDLLGMAEPDPAVVCDRWRGAGPLPHPAAPIGVTETGPLVLDLLVDGPHALLAGTTGAGKSELLRTLVVSLAASVDPEHLSFVLVDYKGGSAFDACAALPHTAGMVTDLDDRLAERALRCLEAELRYREERLREVGADDLPALLALGPAAPLPRMVIVIDEFAAMAKELPDFMDALVDIAARGRSLGVHLVLATQRPAGVIRDNVRANTNMRIALRVQDTADSSDVIGDGRAARLARSQPGRGYLRLGPTETVAFQTALVTGTSARETDTPRVPVARLRFGVDPVESDRSVPPAADGTPTDLERLVAAIVAAAADAGMRPVRRPWPDPLPPMVAIADLATEQPPDERTIPLGLVDEPDLQRQRTMWWGVEGGSQLLFGVAGSGTTTTMVTIALGLAAAFTPDELHMYAMDFGAGDLAPLSELPHTGGVVGAVEPDRQTRLVRMLTQEFERRKQTMVSGESLSGRNVGGFPRIVVFVDGYEAFAGAFEGTYDLHIKEAMMRLIVDGPSVGITTVVAAQRVNALPQSVVGVVGRKLLFHTPDAMAAASLGLRSVPADLPPGRALHVGSGRLLHIAVAHHRGTAAAVADLMNSGRGGRVRSGCGPAPVGRLPTIVKVPDVAEGLRIGDDEWRIPIGIGDTDLAPAGWVLPEGDHVVATGEARSGRSTLLAAIATMVAEGPTPVDIVAVAPRRSPLREVPGVATLVTEPGLIADTISQLLESSGHRLVLIDDSDDIEDQDGVLAHLAAVRDPQVHVIAAARRDIKSRYNHWVKGLTASRQGLWLGPGPGLDGDLWSTPMPRRIPTGLPVGCGYLVSDGAVELVQTAM